MACHPALFAQVAAAFNRPPLVRDLADPADLADMADLADLAGMSAWDPVRLAEAVDALDQVGIVDGSSRMSTDTQNYAMRGGVE